MDPKKVIVLSGRLDREHPLFSTFTEVAASFGFEQALIERPEDAVRYLKQGEQGALFCDGELYPRVRELYERHAEEDNRLPVVLLIGERYTGDLYDRNVEHYLFLDMPSDRFEMLLFSVFKYLVMRGRLRAAQGAGQPEFTRKLLSDTAHAINNILTGMTGYAELAQLNPDDHKLLEDAFNVVIDSATRVRNEIKNLRAFIRVESPQFENVNLHDAIGESLDLLRKEIRVKRIRLDRTVSKVALVHGDYNQLVQVFFNLASEMVATVPQQSAVSLRLGSSNGRAEVVLESDRYMLSDQEYTSLQRIFAFDEPVLKMDSREGRIENRNVLSICNRIAHNHGGSILLSRRKERVAFTVRLPVVELYNGVAEEAAEKYAHERIDNLDLDILVVDDEEYVRNTIYYFFDKKGCRVTMAEDGAFGFQVARDKPFDLVFMDYLMPKMGGIESARKIMENNPDSRIVFISGQEPLDEQQLFKAGIYALIRKPFEMSDLYDIARKVALQKGIVD
jgi:two-component system NtrC family sensor kinase